MSARHPWDLPLLLAGAFRAIVDELHDELAEAGHAEARPIHGFALQAIGSEGITVSELGRRLGVTKQAAAKTAANLERLGYVDRMIHPDDQRAVLLRRAQLGDEMLALSAQIFGRIRSEIADQVGKDRLSELEVTLVSIARNRNPRLGDLPGWLS